MDYKMSYVTLAYYVDRALGLQYCLMPLVGREGARNSVRGSGSVITELEECRGMPFWIQATLCCWWSS